jgi:UDP-2,3-diacylglucosamine pyrophosphatase LpxH
MPRRTHFVSDLHMFSGRSLAPQHDLAIHEAASKSHTFVLGGDIFDFRWSKLASPAATVKAAMAWLDSLVSKHQSTQFHFVVGNHDFNRGFLKALETYSVGSPNLAVHHYYLRLGKSLFMHGDVVDGPRICPNVLQKRRETWLHDEIVQPWRHKLYDMAVQARLHKIAGHVANPKQRVGSRILGYLDHIEQTASHGVKHVYFGHTHVAMSNYQFGGVSFHNGGAPMPGLTFRIVETAHSHTS